MNNYDKLIKVLKEIFQLDQADLDFGIYRIMNQKSDEIQDFLTNDLIPQIKSILQSNSSDNKGDLQKELDKLTATLKEAGMNPDDSPKVKELKSVLGESADLEEMENEVFSHLAGFFKRYYDNGDFISMRRYKKDVYAIPYEGEEVKLHWANNDQYYIKSSEYLKNYSFKISDTKKVNFVLIEAGTEQNNNKAQNNQQRRFAISEENVLDETGDELNIYFTYDLTDKKIKQKDLLVDAVVKITDSLPDNFKEVLHLSPTDKNKKRTLLEKQLTDYTARNSFDYFIHKDLGGFLQRELDFYIKNEVLFIDDLNTRDDKDFLQQLSLIKAIKSIGLKVITFLAQLEDFQKKLWLKKKFVVDTNYCITLDKIPESYYAEIVENKAQLEEWVKLFAIDEIKGDLVNIAFTKPLSISFLKNNPFLVLDTMFFSASFKEKLLEEFDDLDEELNGLLINSENFQALNLIQKRHSKKLAGVYIDPPYNTNSTPILYKNEYKHSSWVSLMSNRILLSNSMLDKNSVTSIAIDDAEMVNLSKLLEDICPNYKLSKVTVVHNPKGSITKEFNRVHEYALFLSPENGQNCIARTLEKNEKPRKMRRWGENSLRTERKLSFYPIYIKENKIVRIGEVPDDNFHPTGRNVEIGDSGELEIWPIDQDGIERRWNFGLDSISSNIDRITIQKVKNTYDLFLTHELTVPKTVWSGGEYDAGNYGNTLLINILGVKLFDFPKSINLVKRCLYLMMPDGKNAHILDYFAGSGTTGHAIITLNREDKGKRKFILVEMGEYFNTVTKPRIQKVIYSKDWKDGKPVSREGSSHFFKYLTLESYEDTLNNLVLNRNAEQQGIFKSGSLFKEDYMLSYMLDVESEGSLLNTEFFSDPFNYQLNITRNNETKRTNIDLIETFNYLIGLVIKTTERLKGFKVIIGENLEGEKILVIWRVLSEKNNVELDEFFMKQSYNTRDGEFDRIYVNGDNNLENLKVGDEKWKVVLIEEEFKKRMFDVQDI